MAEMEIVDAEKIAFDTKHKGLKIVYDTFQWNTINNQNLQKTWWKHGKDSRYSGNSYSFIVNEIPNKDISKKHLCDIANFFIRAPRKTPIIFKRIQIC